MENAGIERLKSRIEEVTLPEAKQKMQSHLQESVEHQKRLQQLISKYWWSSNARKIGFATTIVSRNNNENDDKFHDKTGMGIKKG